MCLVLAVLSCGGRTQLGETIFTPSPDASGPDAGNTCDSVTVNGRKLTTLASGQSIIATRFGLGIAVDANNVYWTTGDPADMTGSVMELSLRGCGSPTALAAGQPFPVGIVASGADVYFAAGGVRTCAVGGCGGHPTVLASQPETIAVVVDERAAYWTNRQGWNRQGGSVMTCPRAGCAGGPIALATGLTDPGAIALDATAVYWGSIGGMGQLVMKCALGGCNGNPTVLTTSLAYPGAIATDGTSVYWTTVSSVMKCSVNGCASPTTLATTQSASGLAVDGMNVYWTDDEAGTVSRCAVTGCGGSPTVLASGQHTPVAISVDGTSAYWVNAGGGGPGTVMMLTPK